MTTAVKLNVYELIQGDAKSHTLSNDALGFIGMGIYHTGIEVHGEEISFGMDPSQKNDPETDGVFIVSPGSACGKFKESIELGKISLDESQVGEVLDKIRPDWRAAGYHILGHNCNCFTYAFSEALDPKLHAKYPSYINRAATAGNTACPDALLKTITNAVAPPTAAAPELINKIFINYNGDAPKPLPAQKAAAPASSSGGGGGMFGAVKGFASKAASVVSENTVGAAAKSSFKKSFPELSDDTLLDKYSVDLIHINRVQSATVYITDKGIAFKGPNKLHLVVKYGDVSSFQYGTKIDASAKNYPPSFNICAGGEKEADSILIYLTDKGSMIPLFKAGANLLPGANSTAIGILKSADAAKRSA